MNILRWRSFVIVLLLDLSSGLRLKAEAVPLPVVNPSFEALTGTAPAHFDASGHLLDEHYSNFPGYPIESHGYLVADAIPGWSGKAKAGTFNPSAALFPGGVPDGQNTAWINVTGTINQTLSQKFEAGRQYRLSVDVGAPAGLGFPGYVVGLYANGQAVAVDENTNTVGSGGFATVTVAVTLPEGSPAVGALIEIRLGIPGSKSEQTDFDNVRLTAEAPVGACAVAPAGLVGWWRAEGDPRDMLANGHETSGGKFEPGVVGQAFSFGGTAPGIIVGDPAAFHTQDFSIEAWVKRASTSLASQLGFGAALFSGGGGSYSLVILDDGALGVSQVGVDKVLSTGRVTDTRWHHVAVTKAGPDVRFYIDGAAAGSAGYDRTFTFGTPFAIGSLGVTIGQNYTFLGSIDELSLYKRALSATELGSIYSAGSFGKCAPRPENIQLTATAPANAQPGADFMVTFTLENHGTQPATGAALSVPLPTSFTLVTNTTSQGASFRAGGALLTVLGPLPGGGNAVVTLTGHSTAPASLVFHGQATRDGTDVSLDGNQADAGVEVLGPCVPAPSGLVAWLCAEGAASDVFSDSGTFTGNPRYAAGKTGLAFDLDGASEIVINDSPELGQSTFTIETWIYPTVVDGTVDIIANKETSYPSLLTDIQFELGIKGPLSDAPSTIPMGNLAFFVSGVRGLPDNYGGWTDAKAAIPLNQWTHVAFTVAPGTVTAYVNGAVTFKATELTGSPVANNWPLKIGSRSTVYVTQVRPQDRFNGRIDEFSFYGRALTGAEIGSVFQAGSAGKCIPAYAPSIQAGPSDQTVSFGADGRFSVVATGTGPLRYQWRFQDSDITGATNAQLLLPKVKKSAAGKYSVAVCNAAGCAPVVSANLFVDAPVAVVRIGDATAKAPEPFSIPLLLVGNGDENAVGLSIRFDPRLLTFIGTEGGAGAGGSSTRLNSSQATNGAVGILIGLQSGAQFPRGTNELIRLRFQPKVSAVEVVTPVQISDSPAKRQLADVDANALPVVWMDGNVRILATDFEGDVGPAPVGDRRVTAADWVLIGRYVAGLEVPADDSLFQRADCAPLSTGGNGRLTVGDWVQAGRFAVGLDPLMPANGPAAPVARALATNGGGRALPQSPGARVVSISGGEFLAGQVKEVSVRLAASGDENALAFSVRHDPTRLRFVGADLGADAAGATLNINSLQGSDGRIGLVLALPASARFVAGDIEVAKFRFAGLPGGTGPMDLAFSDAPVFREVASATAETLPSLWADTVFTVASRNLSFRVVLTADGPVIELSWPTGTTDLSLESATDPVGGKWSPVVAVPVNDGASRIVTLPLSATSSYYRLVVP